MPSTRMTQASRDFAGAEMPSFTSATRPRPSQVTRFHLFFLQHKTPRGRNLSTAVTIKMADNIYDEIEIEVGIYFPFFFFFCRCPPSTTFVCPLDD